MIDGQRVTARQRDGIHWTYREPPPAREEVRALEMVYGDVIPRNRTEASLTRPTINVLVLICGRTPSGSPVSSLQGTAFGQGGLRQAHPTGFLRHCTHQWQASISRWIETLDTQMPGGTRVAVCRRRPAGQAVGQCAAGHCQGHRQARACVPGPRLG